MSSCHSRHCQCSLATHPPGGTLVQEGWFSFPDTTNLCDKFSVPQRGAWNPRPSFLSKFSKLVIYPAGLTPFKFLYNTKIKLFLFLPRFVFFPLFFPKEERIQFTIRGGVVLESVPYTKSVIPASCQDPEPRCASFVIGLVLWSFTPTPNSLSF